MPASPPFAAVITVSDRCARGEATDVSGPVVVDALTAQGYEGASLRVVPDGVNTVADALQDAVAAGSRIVITTGGTGLTERDHTPEGTRRVIEREIPGIAEAIRAQGAASVPTALLTRGVAGTVGRTLIVNLPGSPGGVRDGIAVLAPLMDHILAQLQGIPHD